MKENFPVGTIHMIGGPHEPELENRIWKEINIVKKMNEYLSVHPMDKKPRQSSSESSSSTFTQVDISWAFPHSNDPVVIHLQIHSYDVKQILVDCGSSFDVI